VSDDQNQHQGDGGKEPDQNKKGNPENFPIQEYRLVPADQAYGGYEEDEIDLIELAKTIWDNRTVIYKFVAVGVVLGVLIALLSPKEYVSTSTLMPEYSTESQGGGASDLLKKYGGLVGLSGGTYNSASNAIRVDLYPKIVESLSFQDKLAREPFYFPDYDTTASLYDYYLEIQTPGVLGYVMQYTIGLPGIIIGAITAKDEPIGSGFGKDQEIMQLSKDEMKVITSLKERVTASLDEETGVVSVSAKMSSPELAAHVAKYTITELTNYLTEYRTEKVQRDLEFVKEQMSKAEVRFKKTQDALANFRDSNKGSLTNKALTEQQRLQSEFDIAFNVYDGLNQQYEQAKLKVQEETPVFKVLQPVQVPVDDETSGAMVLIVFVMLSGIASIGWIFIRQFLATNPFKKEE
jgi:uncharacterized protein involved in exopolysaccharide biosynthesis